MKNEKRQNTKKLTLLLISSFTAIYGVIFTLLPIILLLADSRLGVYIVNPFRAFIVSIGGLLLLFTAIKSFLQYKKEKQDNYPRKEDDNEEIKTVI